MKRLIDVIGSIVALVVFTPTMLVIMLLIKLEDKGLFFMGKRELARMALNLKCGNFDR